MKENIKNFLLEFKTNKELLFLPFFFLIIFFSAQYGWQYFGLPTQDQIISTTQNFFKEYGLWVIFISSIVESMLFLGWYFPGSLVIFLGVAATSGHPLLATQTVLAVCAGMIIGYSVNYFLGKYGWYKVLVKFGFKDELIRIEKRLENKGLIGSFFLYIMPGMGSLLSTAFGVLKFNFFKFLFFTGTMVLFWDTLWGIIVYTFGMPVFKLLTNGVFVFIIFIGYLYYLHTQGKLKLTD